MDDDLDIIEGYCMHCRETVEIEEPDAVWTRRGMPATRGTCPTCGGAVFRMGRTDAHDELKRPAAVQVATNTRMKLAQDTAYVNFSKADMAIAHQLASDLEKLGIATWLHSAQNEDTHWAGGVHPALKECARMVYVLTPNALSDDDVASAWRFFKDNRKPIIIVQYSDAEPPDAIRRSPRFNLTDDYKIAFRQIVQALSE